MRFSRYLDVPSALNSILAYYWSIEAGSGLKPCARFRVTQRIAEGVKSFVIR